MFGFFYATSLEGKREVAERLLNVSLGRNTPSKTIGKSQLSQPRFNEWTTLTVAASINRLCWQMDSPESFQ